MAVSDKIPWSSSSPDPSLDEYKKFDTRWIEPTKYDRPRVNYIPRQTGSTNWILKGAIINEEVIIVCKDGRCKDELRRKYHNMRREFYYELTGREYPPSENWPMFITIAEYDIKIRGRRVPIVFDNCCFF